MGDGAPFPTRREAAVLLGGAAAAFCTPAFAEPTGATPALARLVRLDLEHGRRAEAESLVRARLADAERAGARVLGLFLPLEGEGGCGWVLLGIPDLAGYEAHTVGGPASWPGAEVSTILRRVRAT